MQEEMQRVMEEECPNEEQDSTTKEVEVVEIKERNNCAKLWSEEDEISLLSGYYEYQEKKGKSSHDVGGFYEFIKHRLIRSSVKQSQISDKICRLKKKFMDHASKFQDTNNNIPHDPHLEKLFELSRRIWCIDPSKDYDSNTNYYKIVDENILIRRPDGVKNFDLSNNSLSHEFLDFLHFEGVDVDLLDTETVTNLKRQYGEVELSRSKFEYKQAKLITKMQNLKYDHYKRALDKF